MALPEAPVAQHAGPWSLVFCSVLGGLSCAALMSFAYSRGKRSTRDIRAVEPRFYCDVDGEEDKYTEQDHLLACCDMDHLEDGMEME